MFTIALHNPSRCLHQIQIPQNTVSLPPFNGLILTFNAFSTKYAYPNNSAGGGAGDCEAERRHLVTPAELQQRKRPCPLGDGIAASLIVPRVDAA